MKRDRSVSLFVHAKIAAWAAQPAPQRQMVLEYFKAEAKQSREWAKPDKTPFGPVSPGLVAEHLADAQALDAALDVLRAVLPWRGRGR